MALKIVYPICCGMDVHKSFVVACFASTDSVGITSYKSRRFSTFTNDLRLIAEWLSYNNCRDICMESTGKYWIPVFNILESSCRIVLAHPKYVKAIRAICRMLLTAIYAILKTATPYNLFLYRSHKFRSAKPYFYSRFSDCFP